MASLSELTLSLTVILFEFIHIVACCYTSVILTVVNSLKFILPLSQGWLCIIEPVLHCFIISLNFYFFCIYSWSLFICLIFLRQVLICSPNETCESDNSPSSCISLERLWLQVCTNTTSFICLSFIITLSSSILKRSFRNSEEF